MEQMKEENCEVLCSSSGTQLAVKQERKAKRDSIETFYDIPPFRARLFQTRLNVRMHSRNSHAASATRLELRIASEKLSFGQTTKVLAFRILFLFFPLNVIRQRQDSRGLPNVGLAPSFLRVLPEVGRAARPRPKKNRWLLRPNPHSDPAETKWLD